MIQRIQTIFLTAIILVMTWFCFTTIWLKVNDKTADKIVFTPLSLTYYNGSVDDNELSNITVTESSTLHILILAGLSALFALISIFSYKNRVRQMKMGFLNTLLLVLLFVLMYYQISEADELLAHPTYGDYHLGFFLPFTALAFNVAANFYIKKDEDLVRSADRIR